MAERIITIMNRIKLPLTTINVQDRLRKDLGDLSDLCTSIQSYGLIQPIVIDQDNRLIAGERRYRAHQLLGLTEIDVVYKDSISEDVLHEMEVEENVRRKEMSWQERCMSIERVHQMRQRRGALEGFKWGQRETQELLGINSGGVINQSLYIAKLLRTELLPSGLPRDDARFWKCENLFDAWKLVLRDREDAMLAELANRGKLQCLAPSLEGGKVESLLAGNMIAAGNESNAPISQAAKAGKIIPLSQMLFNIDCITFMQEHPNMFDHVITDPPYGIDMDMLNQGNDGHAFKDIDTVEAAHTVDGNMDLMAKLFPAVFNTLKDNGFFVLWADQMQWQYQYDLAIKAGFKVQRWPITWVKTHRCMNQSAQFNFTKSTEIAMVCRKGKATLVKPAAECHIIASHDEYKQTLGHPFVKPFKVWEYLLDHVSIENQLILEPFAGRGSGLISAIRKNRQVVGCELETHHYNALLENVKQHYLSINPTFQFQ